MDISAGTLWRNHTHLQFVPDPEPEEAEVEIIDRRFSECQIVTACFSDMIYWTGSVPWGGGDVARVINGAICYKIVYITSFSILSK